MRHEAVLREREVDGLRRRLKFLQPRNEVVWREKDLYIGREMGAELAETMHAELKLLPSMGHYPYLQSAKQTIEEVRAAFR